MRWYHDKWWRFALSHERLGLMWDGHGRWRHLFGPLWALTARRESIDDEIAASAAASRKRSTSE